jgi:hypothetical protein
MIEYLMMYLGLESYEQLQDFEIKSYPTIQLDLFLTNKLYKTVYIMISNFYYGSK